MKARVMEQLTSSGSGGAAAVLTKLQGKANIKKKKCSLATSRRAAMVPTSPNFSEEADNLEVGACLERIQSLVPFTTKNKTLSNLDIITSAIFYIRDLQETLGLAELLDSSVNTEDSLDLIVPSTTCRATEQCSETSSFSTKCSVDSSPPPPTVPQTLSTAHFTSSSPLPALMISGSDNESPLSTFIRQRHPLSVIPSPNTPSASAANCHGYRISQKS